MDIIVHPASRIRGKPVVPGDKSIAHRAAIFGALADGRSVLEGFPHAEDTLSTLACLRQLGVSIAVDGQTVTIDGCGRRGFSEPADALDCGNSGTTMRLLAGLLAGQGFDSVLTGDASLRSRPMGRIARPLVKMGAHLTLDNGHAPISIAGGRSLRAIDYRLPVASAQVKSCVLLAGLFAEGETIVRESTPSRDHTERLLALDVSETGETRNIRSSLDTPVLPLRMHIPGDPSAAAFFIAAATIVSGSEIVIENVGLNPTRSGFVETLLKMGARIDIAEELSSAPEPAGTMVIRSAALSAGHVYGLMVPRLIDEVPILAVTATQASGTTRIDQVAELRVKETDRLDALEKNLLALGVPVSVGDDRIHIAGPQPVKSGTTRSYGDHRIAMSMGIAALVADGPVTVQDANAANVSFPGFWEELERISDI